MFKGAITKINQYVAETFDFTEATLSGSLDIIVIEQPDGQLKSSSFRVRFGKFKVLKSKEKQVILTINGVQQNVKMVLDKSGQAYFEEIREYKDIRKLSEDFNPSESEFDLQSPSDEDEPFGVQRDELSTMEQVEIDEAKQQEDLKKMKKMIEKTDLSPKSNKGIVDSFMGIFKSRNKAKQEKQTLNGKQQNGEEKGNNQPQMQTKEGANDKNSLENNNNNSPKKEIISNVQENQNNNFDETQSLQQEPTNYQIPINIKHSQSKSVDLEQIQDTINVEDLQQDKQIVDIQPLSENQQENKNEQSNNITQCDDQNNKNDTKNNMPLQINLGPNNNDLNDDYQQQNGQSQLQQQQKQQQCEIQEDQQEPLNFQSKKTENQIQQLQEELKEGAYDQSQEDEGEKEEGEGEGEGEEDEMDFEDESIELSLCANLINNKTNGEEIRNIFESKKVTFEDFARDPAKILQNKNLLIRIEDTLHPYELGICMLICQKAFKQQLPKESIVRMVMNKKQGFFSKLFSSNKKNPNNYVDEVQKSNPIQNPQFLEEKMVDQKQQQKNKESQQQEPIQTPSQIRKTSFMPKKTLSEENPEDMKISNLGQQNANQLETIINDYNQKQSLNQNLKKRKLSEDQVSVNSEGSASVKNKKVKKTFRPKSITLESFNLKKGKNTITFSVHTDIQGQQTIEANIFYFQNDRKIVISDIDGTITRSDVLGQLFPMVGSQWVHDGIAKLYNRIHQNGYEILYLTARAIGQSEQTRNFINNVDQDKLKLPPGPIIMSPDRIFKSFTREIIHKKPELFKIAALRDIANLYQVPSPFYAGFGNRETDAIAYKAVGVSMGRIFITNPDGQVFQFNNTYNKTYNELIDMVDQMFPPLGKNDFELQDKFNNSNYWSKMNQYQNIDIDKLLE